jgi:hypothetical protein
MKKYRIAAAVAAGIMAVSTAGMVALAEEAGETCASYLTGMNVPTSIGRIRPTALMIENDADAVAWQHGTSYADVMYEAMVEGAITRMMGIYENMEGVSMIMPIRSCRPYYVYFAREFNAHYGHFGQVVYAVPILQLPTTDDIAGIPYGEGGQDYQLHDGSAAYLRDHDGVTGIYTNKELLDGVINSSGWSTQYSSGYTGHYQFAADGEVINLENGQIAKVVLPGFTYNHARFDYNEADGLYYRSEFGAPQVDQLNGQQLCYKNIIIQECPSRLADEHYLWTDPVNGYDGGTGWFITNGRAEKITWKKENWSADDPIETTVTTPNCAWDVRECDFNVTRYYDANGNEIRLNQGKTFVEIVSFDDDPRIVVSDDPSIDSSIIDSLG